MSAAAPPDEVSRAAVAPPASARPASWVIPPLLDRGPEAQADQEGPPVQRAALLELRREFLFHIFLAGAFVPF